MPRTKAPLPSKPVIAKAMQAYRNDPLNHGNLPGLQSKGHEPDGCGLAWCSIILRLKQEHGLSPTQLMEECGYEGKKRSRSPMTEKTRIEASIWDEEDKIPAQEVYAVAKAFIKANKKLPYSRDMMVGEYLVIELREAFEQANVRGLKELELLADLPQDKLPRTFEDFMAATGLAVYDRKTREPIALTQALEP